MQNDRMAALAERLVAARRAGTRIAVSDSEAPHDFEQGLAARDRVVRALGDRTIGWKVMTPPGGPTLYAPILAAGRVARGGTWTVKGPEPAGIELEVAFRIGSDVAPDASPAAVLDAVDTGLVVFELCQSRLINPEKAPRQLALADCFLNSGLVVGAEIADWARLDLKGRQGRLTVDGKVVAEGKSGDPVATLQSIVPAMAKRGERLTAGTIVITGSLSGMTWLPGDHAVGGAIDGLGEVSMRLQRG